MKVIDPQLSGVTETTLGAMVVVRQTTENADAERQTRMRVVDVRLRLAGGRWSLDTIGSVGGAPPRRPARPRDAALRVLEHPNIRPA
jgi:hypothetical protein